MSIERIVSFVRPSTNVLWFNDTWPASHMEYINETYKDTNKLVSYKELSVDELTMTVYFIFTDEDALAEWESDTYLIGMAANRDAYNVENNIETIF